MSHSEGAQAEGLSSNSVATGRRSGTAHRPPGKSADWPTINHSAIDPIARLIDRLQPAETPLA
jgi:hypothetical protein